MAARKVFKGAWRMPWLMEAMKDATSCDNPGLGASDRMTPGSGGERRELKHLSTSRKRKQQ